MKDNMSAWEPIVESLQGFPLSYLLELRGLLDVEIEMRIAGFTEVPVAQASPVLPKAPPTRLIVDSKPHLRGV